MHALRLRQRRVDAQARALLPHGREARNPRHALFGLSIPGGGSVADADWNAFADDSIGHAFPSGFTVADARGRWRGADGEAVSGPSRVVTIVHPDDGASDAAIRAIVQRYRTTFRQEAVLRERTSVCVSP